MSFTATRACRDLQLPPTQKAVLMCLADYCHDDGRDWHSIAGIMRWTCLSRRTVIAALRALDASGLIKIERNSGKRNTTVVQIARIAQITEGQCATRTGAADAPVQAAHGTGATGALVQEAHGTGAAVAQGPVQEAHQPVHDAHTKNQEAPPKPQEVTKKTQARTRAAPTMQCPPDVDVQVWSDWVQMRNAKRSSVSKTVVDAARTEASKAGIPLEAFLREWCFRGSQGLKAEWMKPRERSAGRLSQSAALMATNIANGLRFLEGEDHG